MDRSIRVAVAAGLVLVGGCTPGGARNRAAAEADVERVRAAFPAPPGAVRLPRQPAGAGKMAQLDYEPLAPNVVTPTG